MTTTLEQVLGAQAFFDGLSGEYIATLASVAEPVEVSIGRKLFHEGDVADACFLILEGDIALEMDVPGRGAHVVQTLHPGDMLGWSWLIAPYRYAYDAQALTGVKAIRFDAVALRAKKEADVGFGFEVMQRFAEVLVRRMQAARLQLLDVYGHSH
jgi:CRP-like cAMP-binding protein